MTDWRGRIVWRLGAVLRPPVSLGVRVLVVDVDRHILLVRHTYTGGWHIPGGAVDPGESAADAAVREVREETGVELAVSPRLHGLFFNRALAARDHVAVFAALDHPALSGATLAPRVGEIAEARLVPLDALPDGVTPATRRRLAEIVDGAPASEMW